MPKYAVIPVPPRALSVSTGSIPSGTLLMRPMTPGCPLVTANSCHPNMPETKSPTAKSALFDSTTCPTVLARITSPICTGGT